VSTYQEGSLTSPAGTGHSEASRVPSHLWKQDGRGLGNTGGALGTTPGVVMDR
ncbi:hypothetical protein NDU88_000244, partial [Pleurodeles waltl]